MYAVNVDHVNDYDRDIDITDITVEQRYMFG
jgi:hypothetical protein